MDYSIIYLVHIFLVTPLFIYPFIAKKYFGEKSFDNYYLVLFLLGIVVFMYHGYKLYLFNKY